MTKSLKVWLRVSLRNDKHTLRVWRVVLLQSQIFHRVGANFKVKGEVCKI